MTGRTGAACVRGMLRSSWPAMQNRATRSPLDKRTSRRHAANRVAKQSRKVNR